MGSEMCIRDSCNIVDGCCMPCALLLLLLSLGHDLGAKKEKNRMRDENKKAFGLPRMES